MGAWMSGGPLLILIYRPVLGCLEDTFNTYNIIIQTRTCMDVRRILSILVILYKPILGCLEDPFTT